MEVQRKSLTQLFVPICFETLFYMLAGMVDTLMLSSVSDQAVGAVGTANTYIGVFIIMFGVISSGMVAVMTQNIGAGKPGIAYQARQLGLLFNAIIGVLMSVFLAFFSGNILKIVSIAPALLEPAETYLLFECTYSYFFKLSACFWIHEAIAFCISCRKCYKFCPQCGIFVCHEPGSNGCSCGNSYLTGNKSYNRCGYGSSIDKSKKQSGTYVFPKDTWSDHKDWISIRM